ncbi:hypothetical protein ABIF32_000889 [Bradyrhizobium elkanii]
MDAARAKQTEIIMATIGTFTASDTGYTGSIKTLTLNIKAKLVASEKDNDKAPDYRIFAGSTEFGRRLEEDRPRQRSRISLGQTRRSKLPGSDLRLVGQGRRRGGLQPDLVAPQRRLTLTDHRPRLLGGGAFFAFLAPPWEEQGSTLTFRRGLRRGPKCDRSDGFWGGFLG